MSNIKEQNKIFELWRNKILEKSRKAAKIFCFLTPPPNLTGELHVGHCLNIAICDFFQLFSTLFLDENGYFLNQLVFDGFVVSFSGFDHAGLYAEIIAKKEHGYHLNQESTINAIKLNEQKFKAKILEFWQEFGTTSQIENPVFTFNDVAQKVVRNVVESLRKENLIYDACTILNFDTTTGQIVTDLETEVSRVSKILYFIRYAGIDSSDVVVATTRPETIPGDVGIAFHPQRNQNITACLNPITGHKLPVFPSKHVDPDKGTGYVKLTPAHDLLDYEIVQEFNANSSTPLKIENIMSNFGTSTIPKFEGLSMTDLRATIVAELRARGHIVEERETQSFEARSKRSGALVEKRLSQQVFLKISHLQNIFEDCKLVPSEGMKWINTYLKDLKDWCISRQNFYGHKLYDGHLLDTWFSSGLWPTVVQESANLSHNTAFGIITGHDILFFWICKILCLENLLTKQIKEAMTIGKLSYVYLHGVVCDAKGEKISKSKGNTQVIDLPHTELRCVLLLSSSAAQKVIITEDCILKTRKLIKKIENITKWIAKNIAVEDPIHFDIEMEYVIGYIFNAIKTFCQNHNVYTFTESLETLVFKVSDFIDKKRTQGIYKAWRFCLIALHTILPVTTAELYSSLFCEAIQDTKLGKELQDELLVFQDSFYFLDNIQKLIKDMKKYHNIDMNKDTAHAIIIKIGPVEVTLDKEQLKEKKIDLYQDLQRFKKSKDTSQFHQHRIAFMEALLDHA